MEGPKVTSQPQQVNKTRNKFVGDDEGRRTGVIVGTVIGCTAVVALIVILTILVSQFFPAYHRIQSCMSKWSNVGVHMTMSGVLLFCFFLCV